MAKKIKLTAAEFNSIFGTHKGNGIDFFMTKDNNGFHFTERIKPWLFALLFVPEVVCQFFYCLWDGGLREFSLPYNTPISAQSLWLADMEYIKEKWEKAEKFWERG